MKKLSGKTLAATLIVLALIAFFYFDLSQYMSLEYLKAQKDSFLRSFQSQPILTVGVYFFVYVLVTALSLPGAAILTLLGGALFGVLLGTVIVSFASTSGATLAFLISRFLLKDYVQNKFGERLKMINDGVKQEGAFYLFTLRLIPVVPFFVINLVMGLTPIKTRTFFFVSQIGMLAGTIAYVNAGTQLSQIESLSGILSPSVLASFAILGILPIASKKLISWVKSKRNQHAKV